MNKFALTLSAIAITMVSAGAQAHVSDRVDTHKMSTAQIQELIQTNGAVVLATDANHFDRYVSNSSECLASEELKRAYIPTADSSSAFVGYTCVNEQSNN